MYAVVSDRARTRSANPRETSKTGAKTKNKKKIFEKIKGHRRMMDPPTPGGYHSYEKTEPPLPLPCGGIFCWVDFFKVFAGLRCPTSVRLDQRAL